MNHTSVQFGAVKKIILFLGIIMMLPGVAFAFGQTYYGGEITKVTYCTCYYDLAVILGIKDVVSGRTVNVKYSLFYSTLHSNFNLWETGPNVIGGYTSGDTQCRNTSGYTCSNSSSSDKIDGVVSFSPGIGTSLK